MKKNNNDKQRKSKTKQYAKKQAPNTRGSQYKSEAAMRAAKIKENEKKRQQKRRRENIQIFKGRLLVFIIILLILASLTFVGFMVFFHRTPDAPSETAKFTYYYGGSKKRVADAADCLTAGGVYFCFNDLSDYVGMAESGSADEMKFILPNTSDVPVSSHGTGREEYILFKIGSKKVTINGQEITLDLPNIIHKDKVWVSLTLAEKYMIGLKVTYNERASEISISRIADKELSTDKETVYENISFKLKTATLENPVSEDPLIGDVVFSEDGEYSLEFTADLSEYEDYMNPAGDMRDAFLTLVNADNTMSAINIPTDLNDVKYTSSVRQIQQLKEYAAKALEALFTEMQSLQYYDMSVFTGYRSYADQETMFLQYVTNEMNANPNLTKEQAEEIVQTYYMRPGTSDHQTGLSVDMDTMGAYTTDFQFTDEYKWLTDNAWKFGFILRYPSDKEDITKCDFEPWHYRYVGRYHALKIHESGLCLEEYLEKIKK